jgi:ribosomal protein S18 acetylase RimI-like enzyme
MDDLPALHTQCWATMSAFSAHSKLDFVLKQAEKARALSLVVLAQARLIGYGQILHWQSVAEIADLFISEAWRNQGIGTALMGALIAYAQAQGWERVSIGVAHDNPRAHALYLRLGFRHAYDRQVIPYGVVHYLEMRLKA